VVRDTVWHNEDLVKLFLNDVRGGIPYITDQMEIMLRVLAKADRPISRFLDLGCGDGALAQAVLSRFPRAEAVLVDFSAPMLAAAQARLGDAKSHVVSADFGSPVWLRAVQDYSPLDAVVSGYAIHHQTDARKREVYAEIFSLLAPGGVFVNIEIVKCASTFVTALSDQLFISSLLAHNHRQGGNKSVEQIREEFDFRSHKEADILAPVEGQCQWLRDVGFADVDCYFKVFELAVFGGGRPLTNRFTTS